MLIDNKKLHKRGQAQSDIFASFSSIMKTNFFLPKYTYRKLERVTHRH